AVVRAAAAEVRRVDPAGGGGVQLGHEGVLGPAQRALQGEGGGREVGGLGEAGDVGVAGAVQRNAVALVRAGAAQEGAVEHGGPRRIHLDHEGVLGPEAPRVGRLHHAGGGREGGVRGGAAGDVGVVGAVEGDAGADFIAGAADVGEVQLGRRRAVDL